MLMLAKIYTVLFSDIVLVAAALAAVISIVMTVRKGIKNVAKWITSEVSTIIAFEIKPLIDAQQITVNALNSIYDNTKELMPNHGTHLRDTIEDMASTLKQLKGKI
jgi:hypothetical protein